VKRAEALRPLSREHLAALTAAKALREAADPRRAGASFLDFWQRDGRRHFRVEEEVLLPGWALAAEVDRPGVARMLEEHLAIRRAALRIEAAEASLSELHELGQLLHDHVRFEERELFPLVEAALEPAALDQLGAAIEAAEQEA
jgi:hemerythrin-like domain-containing protein